MKSIQDVSFTFLLIAHRPFDKLTNKQTKLRQATFCLNLQSTQRLSKRSIILFRSPIWFRHTGNGIGFERISSTCCCCCCCCRRRRRWCARTSSLSKSNKLSVTRWENVLRSHDRRPNRSSTTGPWFFNRNLIFSLSLKAGVCIRATSHLLPPPLDLREKNLNLRIKYTIKAA